MGAVDQFRKQGGMKLIKQYIRAGAFFTAVGEFFLLGRDRIALEILRLSTQYKTRKKLEKKYGSYLKKMDQNDVSTLKHVLSKKIWICWFQGIENAPDVVKKCYESIKRNFEEYEIILITKENMFEYVTFPDFIINKWEKGYITNTHMTDLLRLELLIRHGGTWIDSTVFCSGGNIPRFLMESDLFFFQMLKPGRDGNSSYISSWFMSAKTNNKVLLRTRDLCYKYWEQNDKMVDYFLLHDFMSIVLDFYPEEWKKIPPLDNAAPHVLLLRLFDQYDEEIWNVIKGQTLFHKLTYKFSDEQANIEGTYYRKILEL